MADERHLRYRRDAPPDIARLADRSRAGFLFPVPRCAGAPVARNLVDAAIALGPCLCCLARKSGPRAIARPRYASLYPDGLCDRFESRWPVRRALRATGTIHRAEFIHVRPVI